MVVKCDIEEIRGYLSDVELGNKIIFCSVHDYTYFNKPISYVQEGVLMTIRYFDIINNVSGKDEIYLEMENIDLIKEFRKYRSVDFYLSILEKVS